MVETTAKNGLEYLPQNRRPKDERLGESYPRPLFQKSQPGLPFSNDKSMSSIESNDHPIWGSFCAGFFYSFTTAMGPAIAAFFASQRGPERLPMISSYGSPTEARHSGRERKSSGYSGFYTWARGFAPSAGIRGGSRHLPGKDLCSMEHFDETALHRGHEMK